ncbi:MAG TPA: DUF1318 domain-containing protein [Geobacteraceae bacterium]|nr:DUF1318 domain-containing protein [Geobacteraceae bacterium]
MKKSLSRCFVSLLFGLLTACAFITVNVYFPEKDVKQAYKSLDDMLLKQGEKSPAPEGAPAEGEPKAPEKTPEGKPVSVLENNGIFAIGIARTAYAEEDISKKLAEELSRMPEVQQAYADIRSKVPQMAALRDSGAIGEGNNGSLVVLDKGKLGNNQALVDSVNNDRKTIIRAMAKTTLKLTGQKETSATLKKALIDAAKTFASVRQEKAKPGWFVQQPDGRWVQK